MPQLVETTPITNALAVVAEQNQLPADKFDALRDLFAPHWNEAAELVEQAKTITVTDATQLTEMKRCREIRLKLVKVGTSLEKTRKDAKEDSLRTGKVIDGMANVIKFSVIEPQKDRLEQMEKFAERAEAERKAKMKASREELLAPFGVDSTFYDLSNMPEATFATLLDSSRLAHESRLAAAAKAEADRIAADQARIAEEARIRAENERLRREAEEQAKVAAAERAKAEAERKAIEDQARKEREEAERQAAAERARVEAERKAAAEVARKEREAIEAKAAEEHRKLQEAAAAERAERERLEQGERDRVAAEMARKKAEEAAKKKAARAPDADKVRSVARIITSVAFPECSTSEGIIAMRDVHRLLNDSAARIEAIANSIA